MRQTLTIGLPPALRSELDAHCEETGASRSSVACESIADYLFVRRFRRLRRAVLAEVRAAYG